MGLLTGRVIRLRTFTKKSSLVLILLLMASPVPALAGPYPPAAQEPGSTAVNKADRGFVAWAEGWEEYLPGCEVSVTWKTPDKALGPAEGTSFDIVCLGRGGSITLTFEPPIKNGKGWDFAVFENSFNDTNLELAYVEVSSDGTNFLRFDNDSLTSKPVGAYGALDPTDIDGVAGKYRQGFGTPFDLQNLAARDEVLSGIVNLARISHVRVMDIVGDGTCLDTSGDVIYDPYPTVGSAGFDLDAIGARYENTKPPGENHPPEQPALSLPEDASTDVTLTPMLVTESFYDPDEGDAHSATTWQISNEPDFSNLLFDETSSTYLTERAVPLLLLEEGATYYWRVKFYDDYGGESVWSDAYSFATAVSTDNNPPDQAELSSPQDNSIDIITTPTLETDGFSDPDEGDSHALTRWQMSSQADFSVIVFEQPSSTDLTSIVVSDESKLSYGETYHWRVKFYDNHGAESVWSEPYTFTTTEAPKSGKAGVSGDTCFVNTAASSCCFSTFFH
jgi:hypothetical protein